MGGSGVPFLPPSFSTPESPPGASSASPATCLHPTLTFLALNTGSGDPCRSHTFNAFSFPPVATRLGRPGSWRILHTPGPTLSSRSWKAGTERRRVSPQVLVPGRPCARWYQGRDPYRVGAGVLVLVPPDTEEPGFHTGDECAVGRGRLRQSKIKVPKCERPVKLSPPECLLF